MMLNYKFEYTHLWFPKVVPDHTSLEGNVSRFDLIVNIFQQHILNTT